MSEPHPDFPTWPPRPLELERIDWLTLQLLLPSERFDEGTRARDAVSELAWDGSAIRAVVDGHLVRISETGAVCGCGEPAPCRCAAAALIAWIERRPELIDPQREHWGEGAALAELLQHALIEGAGDLRGLLDLDGEGERPRIVLDLEGDIRGRLGLEGRWLPSLLDLEGVGIEVGERLEAARRPDHPLRPCVAAELTDDGGVAFEWFYRVDQGRRVERAEVDADALGGWTWVDTNLHPVAACAPALARYWGKVRDVPPTAAFEFVRTQLPPLRACPQFEEGPLLAQARVLRNLAVQRVELSRDPLKPWFYLEPLYGDDELRLALDQLRAWRDEGRTRVRQGAVWIELPTEAELARFERLFGGEPGKPGRLDGAELLRYAAEWHGQVEIDAAPETRALLDRLLGRAPLLPAEAVDQGLNCELRDYQREGLAWLTMLANLGLGGVLADEMGLGKTVQTLALLSATHADGDPRPSLVICPRSVLDHWADQVARLAPGLRVHVHHGAKRNSRDAEGAQLWATTYETAARDIKRLSAQHWRLLILDEAQKAKNVRTRIAKALRKLDADARFALTGTPIENSLDELWAHFDLLLPGHLGPRKRFADRFVKPIEERNDEPARVLLGRLVRSLILRRRKCDVLDDLPEKIEDIRTCRLSAQQEVLYRQILEHQAPRIIEDLSDRKRKVDFISILAVLTKLKQLCDHPSLVLPKKDMGADPLEPECGKFDVFRELLAELLDAGKKVVVFSQYLGMLDLLQLHCDNERVGWSELRGATTDRAGAIARFQSDPDCRVFLASLGAAGVGIDLTAATAVIHYDRWWTAAREDQATDRVHRIGQDRGVLVYKLMTRGTIEERIDQLIEIKSKLASDLLDGDLGSLRSFDRDELIGLLSAPE